MAEQKNKTASQSVDELIEKMFNDIADNFPASSYEEWKQAATDSLKGKPVEKLATKTYEDIEIQPIYNMQDLNEAESALNSYPGFYPFARATNPVSYQKDGIDVAQAIPYALTEELNAALINDLKSGQTAIVINTDFASSHGLDPDSTENNEVGIGGTSIFNAKDFDSIFANIDLNKYSLQVNLASSPLSIASLVVDSLKRNKVELNKLKGSFGFDFIGSFEASGFSPCSFETSFDHTAVLIKYLNKEMPNFKAITINGDIYNQSAGNAVQELAFSFGAAVAYMRELQNRGLSVDEIASNIKFSFSMGPNFFMEIAKLRAARMIWAKIVKEFGGNEESQKMDIHTNTCKWNKSSLDAYTNLLRLTNETLASIVGGTNSMTVGNFDASFGIPDEFSRRIARNTQIVLNEECNLKEVTDPAGGSWFVEVLTSKLAKKAWELFAEVESKGGMPEVIKTDFVEQNIEKVRNARLMSLASRKDILVGVNKYSNLIEKPINTVQIDYSKVYELQNKKLKEYVTGRNKELTEKKLNELRDSVIQKNLNFELILSAVEAGATLGEITSSVLHESQEIHKDNHLSLANISADFEELRKKADEYKANNGAFPSVFLATMGPVKQHKPRADFSIDFFRVGGFEAIYQKGFENVDEAVKAIVDSKTSFVALCSTDDTYPEIVPELCAKLKSINKDIMMILAGYPADKVEDYKNDGIHEFIHIKANIVDVLTKMQNRL